MAFIRINAAGSNVIINTNNVTSMEFYEDEYENWCLEIHFTSNDSDLCYEESDFSYDSLLKLFNEIEKILYTNSNPNQDFIALNVSNDDVVIAKHMNIIMVLVFVNLL